MVVTVTLSGFIWRTKADEYRAQHRGGKGIMAPSCARTTVDHFFLTSTHNWLLFFTNKGPRIPSEGIRAAGRIPRFQGTARGEPAAVRSDEAIQTVLSIPNYEVAKYLVGTTRSGKVKKTALAEYDSLVKVV